MKLNIRSKIVLIASGVLFIAIAANTLMNSLVFTKEYSGALQSRALMMGQTLTNQLDRILKLKIPIENIIGFEEQCQELVNNYEDISYAMIIDLNGKILFHNDPKQQGQVVADSVIPLEKKRSNDVLPIYSKKVGEFYDFTIPILGTQGQYIAFAKIGFPAELISLKRMKMFIYSFLVAFTFLCFGIISLIIALSFWVTKPIDKLMIVIRDIREKGSASSQLVEIKSRDEIGQFGSTFNQMITEIRENQKKIAKYTKNLELGVIHSEKMASIGQLAAGVAHEINNPTGFVSSNLKTLFDYIQDIKDLSKEYRKFIADLKKNSDAKGGLPDVSGQVKRITALEEKIDIDFLLNDILELIEESREGTERIKKIVQDLKDFAHPGEDKPKYTDINKNLDTTLNVVWNELKYKAKVIKDYGDLPEVKCYPQQLNQVFANLLVNAAQAIEKEGEIRIKTHSNNGYVEVTISDTGIGIPEENISKVFEPFFTTKEVGKGTGLGLHVAYNIIKKHGGTIGVKSVTGKGTTFIIRINRDPIM